MTGWQSAPARKSCFDGIQIKQPISRMAAMRGRWLSVLAANAAVIKLEFQQLAVDLPVLSETPFTPIVRGN